MAESDGGFLLSEKVVAYERFLNETLRRDLKKIINGREKVYELIAEYLQLKTVIIKLKDTGQDREKVKTKVDLGCNFYIQAEVPDASRICVCVGYGFFVEFTLDEALTFIEKKVNQLNENADVLTKDAVRVKAHIKLVLQGLCEIQNLQDI